VDWGSNDDTYFQWFAQIHLSNPDSDALMSDMIRFLVGAFHPSNELLASKVIPRYAALGKLFRMVLFYCPIK
jgi:hypothetical protein